MVHVFQVVREVPANQLARPISSLTLSHTPMQFQVLVFKFVLSKLMVVVLVITLLLNVLMFVHLTTTLRMLLEDVNFVSMVAITVQDQLCVSLAILVISSPTIFV
jgi:hypothetical protein